MQQCLLAFLISSLLSAADWITAKGGRLEHNSAGRASLHLSGTWVTDSDLDAIAAIPNLVRLDLSHTRVTDLGLRRLKDVQAIEDLNLFFAELVTDEGVAALKGWKKLRRLNLRGTKVSDNGLAHLTQVTTLEALDAGYAQLTDAGLEHLAALPRLRELTIGGNKLTDGGVAFLKLAPGLTYLDLGGSQRTDSGLWSIGLTDHGLESVAALRNLEVLSVAGTKVTDAGLEHLRGLDRLRSLDLTRTQVTAKGLEQLASLKNLERLNLLGAKRINDDAASALERLTGLKWAGVTDTGMTEAGLAALRKARPSLRVD